MSAKVNLRRWDVKTSTPVLDASTAWPGGRAGFHVDADGSVWGFKHGSASTEAGGCDFRGLLRGTHEYWRCLYADSVFVLTLSPEETAKLLQAAAETVDGPRVGRGRVDPDGGDGLVLSLTGFGTRDGRPIVLGRCMARDQLASPAAGKLFDVYRRIARAEPALGVDKYSCKIPTHGMEIAPGVRAWFAP